MQLGFVIDHSRCIGCHACTVACKSENGVPVGSFRTWVKYTESGSFPEVRRSFAVLRCNQCSSAPCVTICPVHALKKRPDGIVDIDPARCIGCKSCMQGCPYDALYINEDSGTAEKCHFCAHRTEIGLAPACAVVCPTEAIVPGDFHDPDSRVSRMRDAGDLVARKPEAETRPNVWYREVAAAGVDPSRTSAAGGFLWANQVADPQLDAQLFEAVEQRAEARTVYDVQHAPLWGGRVSSYLFTKSLAAGLVLAAVPLMPTWVGPASLGGAAALALNLLALFFLGLTTALLVADLKRPARFLYILRHPNWDSWLTRGSIVLMAYGGLTATWTALLYFDVTVPVIVAAGLIAASAVTAALTAMYTAWLFGQARGRVLWMRRWMSISLLLHAVIAGAAAMLLLQPVFDLSDARSVLALALAANVLLTLAEDRLAPRGREDEFRRASRLLTRGPYALRHWGALLLGGVLPLLLMLIPGGGVLVNVAALLALGGLLLEQDTLVRAGQALPIS